ATTLARPVSIALSLSPSFHPTLQRRLSQHSVISEH
ncbi:hypothetical protein PanWU01x14_004390, partial [Parasponia andersonii]